MRYRKRNIIKLGLIVAIAIIILLLIQLVIQIDSNEEKARKTSTVLLSQIESVIANNKRDEINIHEQLKEEYITRARSIAYMLDRKKKLQKITTDTLNELKSICSVDYIGILDKKGKVVLSTNKDALGLSIGKDEDLLDYFKDMLRSKKMTMSQDMTSEKTNNQTRMYSIVWNEDGTQMILVGVTPTFLLQETKSNQVSRVVRNMPIYDGVQLVAASAYTDKILGATDPTFVGKNMGEIGISIRTSVNDLDSVSEYTTLIGGKESMCLVHEYEGLRIAIIQDLQKVNGEVPISLIIIAIYLMVMGAILYVVVRRMKSEIAVEKEKANTDEMTGLFNRRAYEAIIARYIESMPSEDFVYVAMDINGLKVTNDNLGHVAGDELIKGSASCIKKHFGKYGKVFRMGGDEFAAMIFVDSETLEQTKKEFKQELSEWTGVLVDELRVSCGYVQMNEFPDMAITEIARLADIRMYEEKRAFYERRKKRELEEEQRKIQAIKRHSRKPKTNKRKKR